MLYLTAYVAFVLLFAAIDVTWFRTLGARLYRQTLGDILLVKLRIAPAVAFYLIYPGGVLFFAIAPSLESGSPSTALISGALFGFFSFATYELTNFATLRNWTLPITLIDLAYGSLATGAVAAIVALLIPTVAAAMN
jgi:uncharacterized membrane protein